MKKKRNNSRNTTPITENRSDVYNQYLQKIKANERQLARFQYKAAELSKIISKLDISISHKMISLSNKSLSEERSKTLMDSLDKSNITRENCRVKLNIWEEKINGKRAFILNIKPPKESQTSKKNSNSTDEDTQANTPESKKKNLIHSLTKNRKQKKLDEIERVHKISKFRQSIGRILQGGAPGLGKRK